jgi:hypothetical protein
MVLGARRLVRLLSARRGASGEGVGVSGGFMTFEVLSVIVAINAVATLLLWGKMAGKSNGRPKLNKKVSTALWRSDPIIPKHDPPKPGANFSSLADDEDRQFFADFKEFADVVNWWLAGEFTASRFRLQDLPAWDLNLHYSDGPTLGRSFAIYYNQTRLGRLEISPGHEYSTAHPRVYTSLKIDWARFLSFDELTEFLNAIMYHVTTNEGTNGDYINARQSVLYGLTRTLWDNYCVSQYDNADDEQWGELTVSFNGMPYFYMDRRDAPARPTPAIP